MDDSQNQANISELVVLMEKVEQREAHLICGFLRENQIDAKVFDASVDGVLPHLSIAIGVRIMVPSVQLKRSKEIINLWNHEALSTNPQEPHAEDKDLEIKLKTRSILRNCFASTVVGSLLFPGILNIFALNRCMNANKDRLKYSNKEHLSIQLMIAFNFLMILGFGFVYMGWLLF